MPLSELRRWGAFLILTLFLAGCGIPLDTLEEDPAVTDNTSTNTGGAVPSTSSWSRNDGQTAYLNFSGTVAKACAGDVETVGTFNSAAPSMTFVINGTSLTFPLQFNGDNLLVGVPEQGIDTNTATWYVKVASYSCGGSGGTSGSLAIGTIKVRLYKPSGTCASDPNWGSGDAFVGTMGGPVYDSSGQMLYYNFPISSSANVPSANSSATYWDYTLTNVNSITWDLWPNRSSFPTSCLRQGSATVDSSGQTKQITIYW